MPFTSFLSALTFNINTGVRVKGQGTRFYDCVISFERTTCQDIYRAGDGCHAEWLAIRSETEPFYKHLSFKINPLHIYLLSLEKRLFRNTPLIIANSRMVKEQIIKHYAVPEEKIKIIYNGVDLARFSPQNKDNRRCDIRKNLAITEDTKVLLFVGSGFERKGLKPLIESVAFMKNKDIKALIIGKGDNKKYRDMAKAYRVSDKIIFLGIQKNIEDFYAASDLFILPTRYDPFSNATLEAMASGLPAITTKNNGAAELIENDKEGFVMERIDDTEELAGKIIKSLDRTVMMSEYARKKAMAFPIEHAAAEFADIIRQVHG